MTDSNDAAAAPKESPASRPVEGPNITESGKETEARELVRRNVLWAMGVGLVPVPLVDLFGISTIQLKMLRELSSLYSVPFMEHKAKNILAALVGGVGTLAGAGLLFSVLKVIPILGQTAGAVSVPLTAGAATHVIGKIFVQHFEAGGTFLDFNPAEVREYFRQEFERAKVALKTAQKDDPAAAKPAAAKPTKN